MLKRVIKLNDSGRKQEAAEVALQLERCRNEDANSETEKHIGLGFFQTGQYDKALTAFERVVEMVGPDPDPSDLFNILTSATKAGRFERAEEVFVAIKRSALPLPMPMNTMSYYYACALHEGSRNERAFELIDEIRPLYESLPCLDPHVLFMRGVNPSFLQYLDKAVSISSELKEDHDTVMWLVEFDNNLKDKNKQTGQDIIWKCLFKYVDMSKYRRPNYGKLWKPGDRCVAQYKSLKGWYPAVISSVNDNGTCSIDYDDGDHSEEPIHKIRLPPES